MKSSFRNMLPTPRPMSILRFVMGLSLFMYVIVFVQVIFLAIELHVSTRSVKWMTAFGVAGFAFLVGLALFFLTWSNFRKVYLMILTKLHSWICRNKPLDILLLVFFLLLFPVIFLSPIGTGLKPFSYRLAVYWGILVLIAALLAIRWSNYGFVNLMVVSGILLGGVYRLALFIPDVSVYPFTLSWSEASRFYYASLFFSEKVYGVSSMPTVLHPTRYLMQSVPFLIPSSPIWFHRLWQVLLWVSTSVITALMLIKRLDIRGEKLGKLFLLVWAILFLFQGPVFYHLLVVVIIVLWGFDSQHFWRSFFVVLLASLWAGMSRVNWIPFPGFLAGLLYFLETKMEGRSIIRYLTWPGAWAVTGGVAGFAGQISYALLSGNQLDQFGSSFSSDLLWYRLFPSSVFVLGVLPGILLASLPIVLLIWQRAGRDWTNIHSIRRLGLFAILLVYLVGGLVVSTKIGGGSNLHNLDGYLVLLLVTGMYFLFGEVRLDCGKTPHVFLGFHWLPLSLALIVPVSMNIMLGRPVPRYDKAVARQAMEIINSSVQEVNAQGGEVLFITERQLLTFGDIENVKLNLDYEKVFLMEMVMSENQEYLDKFAKAVSDHDFGLIVVSPQRLNLKENDAHFGEENNAWVEHVSVPLLCHYEQLEWIEEPRIQLLVPNPDAPNCPVRAEKVITEG